MKPMLHSLIISLLLATGQVFAADAPSRMPPTDLLSLCYHDVTVRKNLQDPMSVTVDSLIKHLTWLIGNGYQPISLEQWRNATSASDLPQKPVLLTFDDGYASFAEHVMPLLELFQIPAVLAPVTSWVNAPPGQPVPYGDEMKSREYFLDWQSLQGIARSGLVEIVSHTHDLHRGIIANPFGNKIPAAASHAYNSDTENYESDTEYLARVSNDLQHSTALMQQHLGSTPQAIVWPYGMYNWPINNAADRAGMHTVLTLDDKPNIAGTNVIHRELMTSTTTLADLVLVAQRMQDQQPLRAIYVDMDELYNEVPELFASNLDTLLDRIKDLQTGAVFLKAFSDTDKDKVAEALYFPNRHIPLRADLFNRVSWQLKTRAEVAVYAWMPVDFVKIDGAKQSGVITEIYQDLGRSALFQGVFYDRRAALPGSEDAIFGNHNDQTEALSNILRAWQPGLSSVVAVHHDSYNTAADLYLVSADDFSASNTSNANLKQQVDMLLKIAESVRENNPEQFPKLVFQVRLPRDADQTTDHAELFRQQMDRLISAGIGNIAYSNDGFLHDVPPMADVRSRLSVNTHPALRK